jgi:hypothetical protein
VKKTRKHLTGEEKVAVLRRHLIDKQAVSDICDEAGIQPSQFYCVFRSIRPLIRELSGHLFRFNSARCDVVG